MNDVVVVVLHNGHRSFSTARYYDVDIFRQNWNLGELPINRATSVPCACSQRSLVDFCCGNNCREKESLLSVSVDGRSRVDRRTESDREKRFHLHWWQICLPAIELFLFCVCLSANDRLWSIAHNVRARRQREKGIALCAVTAVFRVLVFGNTQFSVGLNC